jgi:hypothetical protein
MLAAQGEHIQQPIGAVFLYVAQDYRELHRVAQTVRETH